MVRVTTAHHTYVGNLANARAGKHSKKLKQAERNKSQLPPKMKLQNDKICVTWSNIATCG